MERYLLLIRPSVNQVYAGAAGRLAAAELRAVAECALDRRLGDVAEATVGGVDYLAFSVDGLTAADTAYLSDLSAVFALFRRVGGLLEPVTLTPRAVFGSDLLTIQKYPGKTNEAFTRLLLNLASVAMAEPGVGARRRPTVLDPMCGRGTTLNAAVVNGWHAAGVDVDRRSIDAYATFIQTWLKNNRLKHHAQYAPVRRDRQVVAKRLTVELGVDKESYRAGDTVRIEAVAVDTLRSADYFRPQSIDLVVTDTAYGVQHGSRTQAARTRSPMDLLAEALPVWAGLLRAGGALALAWNTLVGKWPDVVALAESAGLEVFGGGPWEEFRHRVDQGITRDVLVARRPAGVE